MNRIFFFDFDGTITSRDSFILFTFHSVGALDFLKYWSKTIFKLIFTSTKKGVLKEQFFIDNFKNMRQNEFQIICNQFIKRYLKKIVKKKFFRYLDNLNSKDTIVIVSASIKNYLEPWCEDKGFDLLCTELEIINQKLSGKFKTPNCNYDEKVKRILNDYDLNYYDEVYAFGNSPGDYEMMELADKKYYKYF